MEKRNNFIAISIIVIISLAIFWQFFLRGLFPFPGDFLLAWFEPWKSDHITNGVITINHKPIADDVFRQIYPLKILAMDMIKQSQPPLWNPYNGAGMPLLATMHTGILNPFNIFFLFLPDHLAWSLYIILQPMLIGICMYLFCRKISLTISGSVFATISFILSGFIVVRSIYGDYDYAIISLPLILYVLESYVQNIKTKKIFLLPLIIFFLFTSVQPQIIVYILTFAIVYLLFRYFTIKKQKNLSLNNFIIIFSFIVLGVGLSAIQLLTTLELFQQANVNLQSSKFIFERFLLPPQHLLTFLVPNYFGNQATYNFWGPGDYIETIAAIGSLPIFFAFYSITKFKKSNPLLKFFLFSILTTILLTINWILTDLLYSLPIPILSTSIPSRMYFITLFSIAILAGFGYDKWIKEIKITKGVIIKSVSFITSFLVIFFITLFLRFIDSPCPNEIVHNCREIAFRNTALELIVFLCGMFFFFLYFFLKRSSLKKIMIYAIPAIIVIISIYNSNKLLPFTKSNVFIPENNLISALKKEAKQSRAFGFGEANIKTDFATHFRFYDPNYYDPLYIKRYGELIAFSNNADSLTRSDIEIINDATISAKLKQQRERLLNLLSVEYFIFKKSQVPADKQVTWENNMWYITKNNSYIPRAYIVDKYEIVTDNKKILNRLFDTSFNPKDTVILEKLISTNKLNKSASSVKIKNDKGNSVLIETSTKSNNILVLLDNYYPGWKAYINGKQTTIFRANYSFRAIELPPGKNLITFSYEPLSFKFGLFISIISGIIYIISFLIYTKNRNS